MRRLVAVAALSLSSAAVPLAAQQTVLKTATSTIELIGLKRWTVRMIEDSLAKYAPDDKLTAYACAAVLREKLHFADASVMTYSNFPEYGRKDYVAITVIEPSDSAKIHYKAWKFDTLPARTEWKAAFAPFRASNGKAQQAIQTVEFFDDYLVPEDSAKFAPLAPLRRVILANRSPGDLARALRTLETDSVSANRVIATLILYNFAKSDSAWWALMDAQRDPTFVSSAAGHILSTLSRSAPRVVDWRPMVPRLRNLLDGTNLFAFDQTMQTLTATSVSPSLAPALLGGGGTIVLAKLRSGDVFAKREAAALLARLSGLPETTSAADFERWIAGLKAPVTH